MKRVAILALLLSACSSLKTDGTRYVLTGTVLSTNDGSGRLVISHDRIAGLMPAMTMPYKVLHSPDVHAGDRVKAILVVGKDTEWLEDVSVTKKADDTFTPMPGEPAAAVLGTEVPDFGLRNQDDKPIHLRQFKGTFLMVTFIYTRCPFPDFCPLMMKNFGEVKRTVEAEPALARKVHFLSVSLDPGYDTPAVLRNYGKRFIPGDEPFERWTLATGSGAEIRAIASYFGVSYSNDGNQINHSLATAIIDADDKLLTLMADNAWKPSDAVAILERSAGVK